MSNEIAIGERVVHPKLADWGIGEITSSQPPNVTVFFEKAGERKLRIDLVGLRKVDGPEAESSLLDSKFRRKRTSKKRRLDDPKFFNGGKNASRKKFIESLGATCANWNWSWSFVNENDKKIFFGTWQDLIEGSRALIFSNDWRMRRGRKQSPWPESRENLRLIEEEGYSLHVYTMVMDPDAELDFELGVRKIGAILNDVAKAELSRDDDNWYAVFPTPSA